MKVLRIFAEIILAAAAVGLVYLIYQSVMQPVNFNKEKAHRESVGIQRLKDIRTLQVAFKGVNGHFTSDIDSLIQFYNEGKMEIIMQIGSNDDSVAVANTKLIKRRNPRITNDQLMALYNNGERLVFSHKSTIPVRDTLFNDRSDFCVDSLAFIPFSGGESILMQDTIKTVSGVQVPLFEASMPYKLLLKGMDNQLRINLDAEREDQNKYPGLQVGSISMPNNNAGNWE